MTSNLAAAGPTKTDSLGEIGVTPEQLREAQRGFEYLLLSKGFKRPFIAANVDDLMARAQFELVRKVRDGERVSSPVGLLITIAYRRTQNLLTSKERAPDEVGLDAVAEVADDEEASPESATLNRDREAKIHAAVARLTVEERKIVALEFFRQMNLSQAARELGWDESKARRRHKSAMKHLHDLLGVDSPNDLVVDVAFFCWLVTALRLPVKFSVAREVEAVAHRAEDLLSAVVDRAEQLVNRGHEHVAGNPATLSVAEGTGRAAKACVVAAICAAVAGVAIVAPQGSGPKPATKHRERQTPRSAAKPPTVAPTRSAPSPSREAAVKSSRAATKKRASTADRSRNGKQSVGEATAPQPAQPSPKKAINAIEATSRPEAGPQIEYPSEGPNGESVESVKKATGQSANESRTSNEFRGLLE